MIKSEYNVLIAMNQPLVEAGISTLLAGHPSLTIVDTIDRQEHLSASLSEAKPDLLIVDYTVPGFLTLDDLQSYITTTNLNVLVISSDDDKASIRKSVQLGIKGYITKECGRNEFMLAVESTAKGEKFFCSKILDVIINTNSAEEKSDDTSSLTNREQEILKMLAQGLSTQKIADVLRLSPHTVQTHRKSIIRKLKIKSPTQFVIFALDMGLISQESL